MPLSSFRRVIQHLYRVAPRAEGDDPTDGQLLAKFLDKQDEAAVAALVQRHGRMVWGVCRRLLRDHHEAEDAFQATFLVLVRKAASVWPQDKVGSWLYGVARQTALKARATFAKRRAREVQAENGPEPVASVDPGNDWLPLLDQELNRLPEKYRTAIVLCDLEGRTRKDVARHLRLPEGTVASRLATARALLAKKLTRQGLALSAGTLATVLAGEASASVPASAAAAAIQGVVSIPVVALAEGVLKAMLIAKLKVTVAVMVGLVVACAGLVLLALPAAGQPQPPAKEAGSEKPRQQADADPTNPKRQADAKVEPLLTERLEVLRRIAAMRTEESKNGTATPTQVLEAHRRVCRAELEVAKADAERVAILEKLLEVARQMDALTDAQHKAGRVTAVTMLQARAERLEAEIELERAKGKITPRDK